MSLRRALHAASGHHTHHPQDCQALSPSSRAPSVSQRRAGYGLAALPHPGSPRSLRTLQAAAGASAARPLPKSRTTQMLISYIR